MKNFASPKDPNILQIKKIENKRRETLEKMFKNALLGKEIKIDKCEEGYCLRIVEAEEPRRFVIVIATAEFMTKERIPFKKICQEAIAYVKEKLKIFQKGFLGYFTLSTEGIKFEGMEEIYT